MMSSSVQCTVVREVRASGQVDSVVMLSAGGSYRTGGVETMSDRTPLSPQSP